jgi:putative methyltransferase
MAELYSVAAGVIEQLRSKKGTYKTLCLNSTYPNKARLYALVCETVRFSKIIQSVITSSKLLAYEKKLPPVLAEVLVYDLLIGAGIQCGGQYKKIMAQNKGAVYYVHVCSACVQCVKFAKYECGCGYGRGYIYVYACVYV